MPIEFNRHFLSSEIAGHSAKTENTVNMGAEFFFSKEERNKIVSAIEKAELNTSGEIRVHIENYCKQEVLEQACKVFSSLKMHKTQLRNGVLFYVAIKDRQFAILGDVGINQLVSDDFWDNTKSLVLDKFKAGSFCDGLVTGIESAGNQLKEFFPYQDDDINELSDEISFGTD